MRRVVAVAALGAALLLASCDTSHVIRSDVRICEYVDTLRHTSTVAPCPDSTIYLP